MNTEQTFELIKLINNVEHDNTLVEQYKLYKEYFHFIESEISLNGIGERFIHMYVKNLLKTLDKELIKILCTGFFTDSLYNINNKHYHELYTLQLIDDELNITYLGNCVIQYYLDDFFKSKDMCEFDLPHKINKHIYEIAQKLQCNVVYKPTHSDRITQFINSDGIIVAAIYWEYHRP